LATERRERDRVNTALEKETSKAKTLEAKVRRRFSFLLISFFFLWIIFPFTLISFLFIWIGAFLHPI